MSQYLKDFKDRYNGFMERSHSLVVGGYWHLKDNRLKFKRKEEDFSHVQTATMEVVKALKLFIEGVEGERDKPGVQPYINEILKTINTHLDRINKYYDKNKPSTFRENTNKKAEEIFQQHVFKGEIEIKTALGKLNLDNNFQNILVEFFDDRKATLPMKQILCDLIPKIDKKIKSLNIDWDLVMDNGFFINMKKSTIPEYNPDKHFWDQEEKTLQFWVSEWNKIINGITIDGYYVHGWLYFHLNFFKTPIGDEGDMILNPPLRDNEWYVHEIIKDAEKKAKELKDAGVFIFGTRRFAKALRNDAKLFYEDREGQIGEAKVGDRIYGSDGKLTTITGVYPQGIRPLYDFKLQDGREILACDEHLWTVFDYQAKEWKTLPTKELVRKGVSFERTFKNKERKNSTVYNYYIPITKPLEYKEKEVDIDPYLLGLWLGDGHSEAPRFTTIDDEIADYIEHYSKTNNFNYRKSIRKDNILDIGISTDPNKPNPLLNKLRDNNLQYNKHIPDEYYRVSLNQRLALLQGILDTDGTCSKGGSISISLANETLAKDVLKLCRSLGISCYIKEHQGTYIKKDNTLNKFWKITLFTSLPVFKLKRKLDRIDKNPNASRLNKMSRVAITSIDLHSEAEATCIRVDNDSHEFVTNDYIVTHNSTSEASWCQYKILTNPTKNGTLTATNEKDIASITDKINIGFEYISPAFYVFTTSRDWKKQVKFGLKEKSGRELKLFYLDIINTDAGSKRGGQKTAGGAPVVFVMDEAGKEDFLKSYNAAVPSFETSEGWKCIPWYVGTGGEEDLSAEAEKVLADPSSYRFVEMDWDILEWQVPKEYITWKRRKFGWFIPAQMGYKKGYKRIKRTLADFLQIQSPELEKVTILQTDWEANTKVCLKTRENLKHNKAQLQQEIVFYPLDPEECFMSAKSNPFPASNAKSRRARLIAQGDENVGIARPVELHRDKNGKVGYELSKKEVATYPYSGGFIDSPFLLYDSFPEDKPPIYRFCAGFDDYKHEESDGDSVGSFWIFDRLTRKKVLSLSTRPDPHGYLHQQIHMALDAYNCKVFPENEDMDIKKYFDKIGMSFKYLEEGFDVTKKLNFQNTGNRKYGWQPGKFTTPFVIGLVVDYCKQEIEIKDEDGTVIETKLGIDLIDDIHLLEEITKFKPEGNFDRIISFGSALFIDHYYTITYKVPRIQKEKREDEWKGRDAQQRPAKNKYFSPTRRGLLNKRRR